MKRLRNRAKLSSLVEMTRGWEATSAPKETVLRRVGEGWKIHVALGHLGSPRTAELQGSQPSALV